MPIVNSAPANDLEPYEIDLQSFGSLSIGDTVRISERWAAKMETAGIDADWIAPRRKGGTITRIVAHRDRSWATVYIRTARGYDFTAAVSQLEVLS